MRKTHQPWVSRASDVFSDPSDNFLDLSCVCLSIATPIEIETDFASDFGLENAIGNVSCPCA